MADLSTFPNLGIIPAQIAMVATSFAAQADFFYRFAGLGKDTSLHNISQIFGLIGFTYIAYTHSSWRGLVLAPWLVVLTLMTLGPSYTGGSLFFIKIDPNQHQGLTTPIEPFNQYTTRELLEIQKTKPELGKIISLFERPIDKLEAQYNIHNSLYVYGPQAGILHVFNQLLSDVSSAFFNSGERTFQDRIAAAQTIVNAKTGDFRIGYIQAQFRVTCTIGNPEWERLFAVTTAQMEHSYGDIYKQWENKKIKVSDLLNMHLQFYYSAKELESLTEPLKKVGEDLSAISEHSMGNFTPRFLFPPLFKVSPGGVFNPNHSQSRFFVGSPEEIGLATYAGVEDNTFPNILLLASQFGEEPTRSEKETYFREYALGYARQLKTRFLFDAPITIYLPAMVSGAGNAFISKEVSNCKEFHEYMHYATNELKENTLSVRSSAKEFAEKAHESCIKTSNNGKECEQLRNSSWSTLNEHQRVYLGYQYAAHNLKELSSVSCSGFSAGSAIIDRDPNERCLREKQNARKALEALESTLVSNVLLGDKAIADGIVESALTKTDQFRSGIRTGLAAIGIESAGLFVWVASAFGGFAAGTYAAIMPLVITWGLAIIIVATPFLYLMGLIIPAWSLVILITPVLGVLYLKSVEITFILIKGIFQIFQESLGLGGIISSEGFVTGLDDPGITGFYDLILGAAYTSSFALSLFLLFGLKNPAGLVQQVQKAGDDAGKISGKEALAGATAALAVTALPGAGIAKIATLGSKAGSLIGKAESAGLISSDTAKNLAGGLGENASIARGDTLTKKATDANKAASFNSLSNQDIKKKYSAKAVDDEAAEANELFKGNGNRAAAKTKEGVIRAPDGTYLPVKGLDNGIDSLLKTIRKAGQELEKLGAIKQGSTPEIDTLKFAKEAPRGTFIEDKEAYSRDYEIATLVKISELNKQGVSDNFLKAAEQHGFLEIQGDYARIIESEGFNRQEAKHAQNQGPQGSGPSGGGSYGPQGGGNRGGNGGGQQNNPQGAAGTASASAVGSTRRQQQSAQQSVPKSTQQPPQQSAQQSVPKSAQQSVPKSTQQSVPQSTQQPPQQQPAPQFALPPTLPPTQSAQQSVPKSAQQSVPKSTQQSVPQSTQQPPQQSAQQSTQQPPQQPVQQPVPQAAPKVKPKPPQAPTFNKKPPK